MKVNSLDQPLLIQLHNDVLDHPSTLAVSAFNAVAMAPDLPPPSIPLLNKPHSSINNSTKRRNAIIRNICIGTFLVLTIVFLIILTAVLLGGRLSDPSDDDSDPYVAQGSIDFYVNDYGAVGDGLHDDGPAIAACIQAATNAIVTQRASGVNVNFLRGIYLFNSSAPEGHISFDLSQFAEFHLVGNDSGTSVFLWNPLLGPLFKYMPIPNCASPFVDIRYLEIRIANGKTQPQHSALLPAASSPLVYPLAEINFYGTVIFSNINFIGDADFDDNFLPVTLFHVTSVREFQLESLVITNISRAFHFELHAPQYSFLPSSMTAYAIYIQMTNVKEGFKMETKSTRAQIAEIQMEIERSTFQDVESVLHVSGDGGVMIEYSSSVIQRNVSSISIVPQIQFESTLNPETALGVSYSTFSDFTDSPSSVFIQQNAGDFAGYQSTFFGGNVAVIAQNVNSFVAEQCNFTNQYEHALIGNATMIRIESSFCSGTNSTMQLVCKGQQCQVSENSEECAAAPMNTTSPSAPPIRPLSLSARLKR